AISIPLLAGLPIGSWAFLPSRMTLLAFLLVPLNVSPLNFLPRAWTPSTYLPGLTLITSFFLSVLPALLTAFWIVRYLQPCLQTTSALFLFLPPLPAIADAGT